MSSTILGAAIEPILKQLSLGEVTYNRLKDIIIRGAFPPNEKLTVRSVAVAIGVSTTPARDAINRLLAEGALVYAGPKTVIIPKLTQESLEEITASRLALEGLAAEKSVQFITDDDVNELELLQKTIIQGLDSGNYRDVLNANRSFHFLIYRRSNWLRLVSMIESLWLQVGPSLNGLYPDYAVVRKGVSNHQWVMDGLRDRDPQKVRSGIEQDLREGYERLSAYLQDQ